MIANKTPTEHVEQMQFIQWFRAAHPKFFIFAIPNGEFRAMTVAKRLKAEGVVAGVPDILVLMPGNAVFIEMKRQKGGTLSKNQKEVIPTIAALGFKTLVCKGALDAKQQFEDYLNGLSS